MKAKYYERKTSQNVTELFGLSRSGKSTFGQTITKGPNNIHLLQNDKNKIKVLAYFIIHSVKHPLKTLRLFTILNSNFISLKNKSFLKKFRIFLMRNSYLLSVLSKQESVSRIKEKILIDEFLLQSIFIILQLKSSKKELSSLMKLLGSESNLLLIEESKSKRYSRFRDHRFPGGHIDKDYSLIWMKNQEHNFNTLKEIINKTYRLKSLTTFTSQ